MSHDEETAPVDVVQPDAEIPGGAKAGSLKQRMAEWAAKNPQEAMDRTAARARAKRLNRMVQNVSGLFTDEDLERAAEVVRESMGATQPVVVNGPQTVSGGKVVNTGQTIEFVPDNKARLEASKFLTAMVEGTPVARQMVVHGDFKDLDEEKRALLMGSQAMQEALADLDEEAFAWADSRLGGESVLENEKSSS